MISIYEESLAISPYRAWMALNVPSDPMSVLAQCTHYVPMMANEFPELKVVKGVVSSVKNLDNISETIHKEYPHMWLVSPTGEIIDPTVRQFCNLGPLDYRAFPDDATSCNKCINCGRYFTSNKFYPMCSNECAEEFG